jgi:hypothetical protein
MLENKLYFPVTHFPTNNIVIMYSLHRVHKINQLGRKTVCHFGLYVSSPSLYMDMNGLLFGPTLKIETVIFHFGTRQCIRNPHFTRI